MSNVLSHHLLQAEQWSWHQLNQEENQAIGAPFLAELGSYLDVSVDVVFKEEICVTSRSNDHQFNCKVGHIISVRQQSNLMAQRIHFCPRPEYYSNNSFWVRVNLWINCHSDSFLQEDNDFVHLALPKEMICSNLVIWIPAVIICDVAFIFHITDIISGKYMYTNGVRNAYFC